MRTSAPGQDGAVLLTNTERADLARFVERWGFRVACKKLETGMLTLRGMLDGERIQPRTRDRVLGKVRS